MTWRLVDDVWRLILVKLGLRELGRLAQVHPYLVRRVDRDPRYRQARVSSIPSYEPRYRKICEWSYWELLPPTINCYYQDVVRECFCLYYPLSKQYIWPTLNPTMKQYLIHRAWVDRCFFLADELIVLSPLELNNFAFNSAFVQKCVEYATAFLSLAPYLSLALVEAVFLGLCRSGRQKKAQALYLARPEVPTSQALRNSCYSDQRKMIPWLISLLPAYRWQDFAYLGMDHDTRSLLINRDPAVLPGHRRKAWEEYYEHRRQQDLPVWGPPG